MDFFDEQLIGVCDAFNNINEVYRHQIFKVFSEEEIDQMANLEIIRSQKNLVRSISDSIGIHSALTSNFQSNPFEQIMHNKLFQVINEIKDCLGENISDFSVAFHSKVSKDQKYGYVDWHTDRGNINNIRSLIYFIGPSSRFAVDHEGVVNKNLDNLNQNFAKFPAIIGENFETVPKGYAAIFRKGIGGAAHATPYSGNFTRFLAVIDVAILP